MTARFSALLVLSACLSLSSPALAQSLLDRDLNGGDQIRIALSGATNFEIRQDNSSISMLSVDALGDGTYMTEFDVDGQVPAEPMSFDVNIDESGKQPVLDILDITQLESDMATIILAHNRRGFRNVTVTIDPMSLTTSIKVGQNSVLRTKFKINFDFTATTQLAGYENLTGSARLRPVMSSTVSGACTTCGRNFAGTSESEAELNTCGTINDVVADATMVVDPDVDDDGSSTFTITDLGGTNISGALGQAGRQISCLIDVPSQDALLAAVEAQIVASCPDTLDGLNSPELGYVVTELDALLRFYTCSARTNGKGSRISLDFLLNYRTATVPPPGNNRVRQGPPGEMTLKVKVKD